MTDRTYKLSLTGCAVGMLISLAMLGTGLSRKYEAHQKQVKLEQAKAAAKEAIEAVYNATVLLMSTTEDGKPKAFGTGFAIQTDSQGSWILTNKHVCLPSRASKEMIKREEGVFNFVPIIAFPRKGRPSGSAIIRVAQNADLCLIRTELKFKRPLKLADKIDDGESIFTFGFPGEKPELNKGKYNGTKGFALQFYSITDMKVWYGASGSAVLNMRGEVVGVMSNIQIDDVKSKKREDVKFSLFVPLEIIREFIGGIK